MTHDKDAGRKTHEDFFRNIFTSLLQGFERVVEGLHVRGCWFVLVSSDVGVNSIGAFPRAPSVGCGLPYHIWSLLFGILLATALGPKLNRVK